MENQSKYRDFLVRDFICDEYFQDWVMHPNSEKNGFWQQWLMQNPEKEADIALAKEILSNIDFKVNRPSPEKARESLEKSWAIIDGLEKLPSKETRSASISAKDQVEGKFLEEEKPVRKPMLYRWLVPAGVAASVLLVMALGWMLFSNNKPEIPVARNTEIKKDGSTFVVRHEVNTTGKEKRFQLHDGSLIVLAGYSEITYREPFANSRDIMLTGKAYFKVAKDKTRPFTVFSGVVSTTALGTEFTVTAFENTNRIIVRLYEGKVVIRPVEKGNLKLKKEVYLLPGQQYVYGSKTVTKMKAATLPDATPEEVLIKELPLDNPSIPQNDEGSWYMFNNQSLDQVFDQLAGMFNVEIVYSKKEIQNIYFTGKYDGSFSLENILKEIATLHNLTITRKENAYIISK